MDLVTDKENTNKDIINTIENIICQTHLNKLLQKP